MRRLSTAAVLCIGIAGWAAPAVAQDIYRCGNSYSQQPCPEGRLVAASDTRSAGQKAQTDQAAKQDAKSAEAMEKARLKEEAKPAPLGILPTKAPEAAQPDKKPVAGAKMKKPEQFTAVSPKKPGEAAGKKKKKKAKKQDS
jgi:hypothetical protein